ncbi:hypothetical protein DL98DRAFT_277928 [Cadophora sp. DSE1049]|nr:hypothetical protein DL98DRAFT_277928 [Cadophora sp. DSE1049]
MTLGYRKVVILMILTILITHNTTRTLKLYFMADEAKQRGRRMINYHNYRGSPDPNRWIPFCRVGVILRDPHFLFSTRPGVESWSWVVMGGAESSKFRAALERAHCLGFEFLSFSVGIRGFRDEGLGGDVSLSSFRLVAVCERWNP